MHPANFCASWIARHSTTAMLLALASLLASGDRQDLIAFLKTL